MSANSANKVETITPKAAPAAKKSSIPKWMARYYTDVAPGHKPHMKLRVFIGFLVFMFFMAPYIVMFLGSVKSRPEIRRIPPTYWPEDWRLDNYLTMWSTPETPVGSNLVSTMVIATCATIVVLLVAMPAAYYTARFDFPGRLAFMFTVLLTQMLQPAVLVAGLFRQFLGWGIQDTLLAMILVNSAFNLSFAVWMMHSFFASVPREIDEAARIDGCGQFAVLFKINLPLVWPGIVTAVIFTFVAAWNEFAASLVILSTPANQPLSVALTKFVGQYQTAWQYVFSVSVVAVIPVIILFAIVEKRLIGGLTAGSIK
ncbi:MAG: carbohydrate ABC transporter permease [Actinomycetaceae bacterium]|nr:carbohydrate ABC transporter permease [Actinomycetaceae bacterium]